MRYILNGLDCPNCANKLECELRKVKGLEKTTIHFTTQTIDLPAELLPVAQEVISQVEPDIKLSESKSDSEEKVAERKQLYIIFTSSILLVGGLFFNAPLHATSFSWAEYLVLIPAFLLVGWPVIVKAFRSLFRGGGLFDENFLMSIATIGAIAIHQLTEAVTVMLFYSVGEYFQSRAVNRSKRSIVDLLNIQPQFANLKMDNELQQVRPEEVAIGQIIVIKPGEKVPLDGEIINGDTFVDTAALTGESVPRKVKSGDTVLAGMINGQGMLCVKVSKQYQDSSVAKILQMVEQASERKAPTEQFITRFSYYYTPLVVLGALLVAIVPPLLIPGATFGEWIYRALILLVISCPCALMISIPLGYFGGIGGASRKGILIKGANFLDILSKVRTVVFDKTGTLTKGVFRVTQVMPDNGFSEEETLAAAAAAEEYSTHPIAQSIREAFGTRTTVDCISDYQEIPGYGISALVNGKKVIVGNDRLLHLHEIKHPNCNINGTSVHVVIDQVYAGYLIISDEIREDAKTAIQRLRSLGIKQIIMLTGDEKSTAQWVASSLGLDQYYAELLPEDKVTKLAELESEGGKHKKYKLAFVGDGINDAPVITRADVGIAMGGLGSDAAIEAADVVLMEDKLDKVVTVIEISKVTRKIVYQNIIMALSVKLFFVILGTAGIATIWEAVFADVGVALLAIINATRVLRFRQQTKP
jgi:Cd2+/Zn2+-exporting ATPase